MYKFELRERGAGYLDVRPIYGEDSKLKIEREQDEMFCRYSFDGNLTFTGKDYDFFVGEGAVGDYEMNLFWVDDKDTTQRSLIMNIPFGLTDMEFDDDNKIVTLSLKGKDKYEEFLNKYDTEYDLVQLAPARYNVDLYKRSFLQLYVLGDTKLTHILGNCEYEVDASGKATDITKDNVLSMGFSLLKEYIVVKVETDPTWYLSQYDGYYIGQKSTGYLWRTDGQKMMKKATQPIGEVTGGWDIWDKDGKSSAYTWLRVSLSDALEYSSTILYIDNSGSGEHIYGGSADVSNRDVYGRIVTDQEQFSSGSIAFDNDVWQKNLNYRYYFRLDDYEPLLNDLKARVEITLEKTNVPNQWQSDGEGMYFVPPTPTVNTDRIIAIGWNQWIPMAIWFQNSASISTSIGGYNVEWTMRDAYSVIGAINALLHRVNDGMFVRSEFLTNTGLGGYSNPILGGGKRLNLYVTPITNVKRTYYSHAAQKGAITLKQILDMLRKCFNCYWFIETLQSGRNTLRIEHIDWFDKGGDYVNPQPSIDLTNNVVNLSTKTWMRDQNKYRYNLEEIVSRHSFKWGDKSSEIFNGFPLVATESFAKNKKSEQSEIANFVADIDIIESSPENLSDDIYVVIGTDENNKVYKEDIGHYLPNGQLSSDYPQYSLQNSMLSFYFLEQKFLNYNLSALRDNTINMEGEGNFDGDINAKSFRKIIRQGVTVPYAVKTNNFNGSNLMSTLLEITASSGGRVKSISTDLNTQVSEIELDFNKKI